MCSRRNKESISVVTIDFMDIILQVLQYKGLLQVQIHIFSFLLHVLSNSKIHTTL